jgi:hypothetical protein
MQVRITAIEETCIVHGWEKGSLVSTVFPLVDGFKDANEQNIYVHSPLRNRNVWLNTKEYELITA